MGLVIKSVGLIYPKTLSGKVCSLGSQSTWMGKYWNLSNIFQIRNSISH